MELPKSMTKKRCKREGERERESEREQAMYGVQTTCIINKQETR